ncbi:MAG TPA: DUF4199 domain-containing protein [Bacteroidia bacterium]
METENQPFEHAGIRYGLLTSLALTGYFLLMQAVGLGHVIELRFLNFIILAYGIYYGITKLRRALPDEDIYFMGLAEGFIITLAAVIPFSAFVSLYLEYIDTGLLNEIRQNIPISGSINGFAAFVVVNLEGLASGALLTYAAMQYFSSAPKSQNKKQLEEKTHIET